MTASESALMRSGRSWGMHSVRFGLGRADEEYLVMQMAVLGVEERVIFGRAFASGVQCEELRRRVA